MKTFKKKTILAFVIVAIAAAMAISLLAFPSLVAGSQASQQLQSTTQAQCQDFNLTDSGWKNLDEFLNTVGTSPSGHNITAICNGWAFQRVDNETIKQYAIELNVTIELGSGKGGAISIVNVTGALSVNSTVFNAVYEVDSGKGVIETGKHVALISAQGFNGQDTIALKADVTYFWWGDKAFAFRGRALLQQANEKPMLLLLRFGLAKVQ
jgi:hypothetical protein